MTTTGLPPAVDPWQGAGLPDATVVVPPPPAPVPAPLRPARRRLAGLIAACGLAVVLVGALVTVLVLTRPHGGAHGPGPDGTGALGALGHGGPDAGRRGAPIGTLASPSVPARSATASASSTPAASGSATASGAAAAPSRTPTHPVATGPTVAPVYYSGYVDLSGLEAVDLETGATGGSATLDVGLGYGALNALHGSYFGDPTPGSGAGVNRSQCMGTAFTDNTVALSSLSAGDEICVRTGAGHVGAIVVSYVQAGTAIGFGWTLWA